MELQILAQRLLEICRDYPDRKTEKVIFKVSDSDFEFPVNDIKINNVGKILITYDKVPTH